MLERFDAVLFDLDGTLADTREDLALSVNEMLGEMGLRALPVETVCRHVGDGARKLVERALPPEALGRAGEALERFRARYRENLLRSTTLYPGVAPTLDALRPARLAVTTNKPEEFSVALLRGLGILDRFDLVLGGDSLPVRKPDPAVLLEAARRLGAPPGRCLVVGDSPVDVLAGRAAGMATAAVTYGFRSRAELEAAGPGRLVDSFPEVLEVFRSG